jgi:beta-glucosidase
MNIDDLVARLSTAEKAALTAGTGMWSSAAIERCGIPALNMTDGPNGARGAALFGAGAATAACIPCGSALGAMWNADLVERLGAMIGEEARTKSCRVLLAPTINLHRSPLGGRNFECYSEDPLVSGRTAAAFIRGVQSRGVAATAKHFVANEAECERYTMNSIVDERTLRELYLVPFEIAVREGGVLAVMTGYNRLNGTYCSEHDWLLRRVLKDEWGFTGMVMTDWFSAGDTLASARSGLDLQMPGPARFFGAALAHAVDNGAVEPALLDDKVRRILGVIDRAHAWEDPAGVKEKSIDLPAHRALAREAACEAAVLLANDGILPLAGGSLASIAAIGPGWSRANLMGGGSAQLRPHYRVAPIETLRQRVGDGVAIRHEPGCSIDRTAPPLGRPHVRTPEGAPGWALEYFASHDHSGPVVHRARFDEASLIFFGAPAAEVPEENFSFRAVAELAVEHSGDHTFTLVQAGRSRVLVDDQLVLDGFASPPPPGVQFFAMASEEMSVTVPLEAGRNVRVVVEYSSRESLLLHGAVVGFHPPRPADMMAAAAAAAAASDVAVVLVGTSHEWESEGRDRDSMDLPGDQNALIERVVAANPNTIVVVNAGTPVSMDWAERARAVLWVWLGGQEMAAAIVDLLFGDAEPAGRLPTTMPLQLEHNPSHGNFPGENGEVIYGERLLVGYRWYDTRDLAVRFPFGHGLSYTTFEIGPPRVHADASAPLRFHVELEVTNRGSRRGAEVVQCYVAPPHPRLLRPRKELKAYAKVWLDPGQTCTARLELDERAFAYWDPCFRDRADLVEKIGPVGAMLPGGAPAVGRTEPGWYVDRGAYELRIARSAADLLYRESIPVADDRGPLSG